MYSIFQQDTTGLWAVKDDSTGKIIARGDTPQIAISVAISKGMPSENREALLVEASVEEQKREQRYSEPLPPTPPTTGGTTAEPPIATTESKLAGTPADGDQQPEPGVTPAGAANEVNLQYSGYSQSSQTLPTVLAGLSTGDTTVSAKNIKGGTNTAIKPGRRTQNPLGFFSSYTYQLSLYMVTPEGYNAFTLSNRKNIYANRDGVALIAQSGGINNKSDKRATGFEFDYYIDDLKMTTTTNGKASLTATNTTELSFNIYEPYGFSFLSNLKRANLALNSKTSIPNAATSKNPLKQFFVLGIKFQGYDSKGDIITGTDAGINNSPNNKFQGIADKYFDISITDFQFNLDGKLVVYKIKAASQAPSQSFGIKRGRIDQGTSVTAGTVDEAITQLLDKINEQQKELATKLGPNGKPSIEFPNVYKVRYVGESTALKASSIVNQATLEKFRYPGANIKTTGEVNDATANKALPDPTQKQITFKNDTPITMAISNIITQSSYLENALKVIYDGLEPSDDPNEPDEIKPPKNSLLQWYTLTSEIKPIAWDTILNDWSYEITYVIQPYSTPNIITPYSDKLPKYYGPHKRYEYWYTGKNSEVISFSQTINNGFFTVYMTPDATPSQVDAGISSKAGTRQPEDRTGALGIGKEAQNSYLTNLYSPKDWAESKITILGDPDFLIQDSPGSTNDVYSQFYGSDGFTINPNGGQVFIEIDFKEAIDYDNKTGVMSLNESINFWQSQTRIPGGLKSQVKGISYMVISVKSDFSKGKFTQVLDLRINTFPQADKQSSGPSQRDVNNQVTGARNSSTQADSGSSNQSPSAATSKSSLVVDQPIPYDPSNYNGDPESDLLLVGNVPQINQITKPAVTTGSNEVNQPIGNNNFVADDDGTTDVINQEIIKKASQPTPPTELNVFSEGAL